MVLLPHGPTRRGQLTATQFTGRYAYYSDKISVNTLCPAILAIVCRGHFRGPSGTLSREPLESKFCPWTTYWALPRVREWRFEPACGTSVGQPCMWCCPWTRWFL